LARSDCGSSKNFVASAGFDDLALVHEKHPVREGDKFLRLLASFDM
jgi:hypothetical protein